MAFRAVWTESATTEYNRLRDAATTSAEARKKNKKAKASKAEGLFRQVHDCVQKLMNNPRHPGLKTHRFHSLKHPYKAGDPVFEAYVQNRTPGAYRLFWCYGPDRKEITIIAITAHP